MQKRFLIIRFSSMGDVILTTALVRCLRKAYPDCIIDFVVKKQFAEVLEGNPHINSLFFYNSDNKNELKNLISELKNNNYSHIIDIQKNIRSLTLRLKVPAKYKWKYSKHVVKRFMLIKFKINLYGKSVVPVYQRYFKAVEKLSVKYDGLGTEMFPSKSNIDKVSKWFEENGASQSRCLALAPGAYWDNKRWLPEYYIALANDLLTNKFDCVVLMGGKGEKELCEHIAGKINGKVLNASGIFSIGQSAAVLSFCKVLVSNDTGLLHMAQSVKTPVVGIFGPTSKELGFYPYGDKSRVAEVDEPCRPCTQMGKNHCPRKHFRCMKNISVAEVKKLVLAFSR
ncbi:MAG: glycosyltransferase family 9 protein [Lentimicrobiaceae bacterium]|nr:glycosyltransferase family 9 protein [Lentimicrobiaceae bacterium]